VHGSDGGRRPGSSLACVVQYATGMRLVGRPVGCAVLACLLLWVAPGIESAVAAGNGFIQTGLNTDGSDKLLAGVHEGHEGPVRWPVCAAGGLHCQPFGEGNPINTGGAPPNSVFIATEPLTEFEATSAVWYGNLSPATAPRVSGPIRANALVTPVAGTWTGAGKETPSTCSSRRARALKGRNAPHSAILPGTKDVPTRRP
jgi:hypothetical protein